MPSCSSFLINEASLYRATGLVNFCLGEIPKGANTSPTFIAGNIGSFDSGTPETAWNPSKSCTRPLASSTAPVA